MIKQKKYVWGSSALPRVFFAHTGTGERTIRQTDRQMLWLYLAVFRCQTAKQSYKLIR